MHLITCAACAVTLACTATLALADDIRTERVQFHKGADSATVEDSIKGYEGVDYVLGAKEGQLMNVSMATDNGAAYFNIIAPGKENEACSSAPRLAISSRGRYPRAVTTRSVST
ncbi:hypothetical protein [uncultured Thiohalocapsa sp.]|uniref:hypothetical protein n=1 Tax=uncultured Thiohalocapsa sp. TaxID=768990 RepID=UPI0025DD0436|nr:hypothetical protein [uncultured Thiohalocapsa sp.]